MVTDAQGPGKVAATYGTPETGRGVDSLWPCLRACSTWYARRLVLGEEEEEEKNDLRLSRSLRFDFRVCLIRRLFAARVSTVGLCLHLSGSPAVVLATAVAFPHSPVVFCLHPLLVPRTVTLSVLQTPFPWEL